MLKCASKFKPNSTKLPKTAETVVSQICPSPNSTDEKPLIMILNRISVT